jgi:HSP20 family protein
MAADVEDEGERILVRLEAPGMEKSDFAVTVEGRHLIVRGEKSVRSEGRSGRFYRVERAYGRFERVIPLPVDVDRDRARASYRRGVLAIELPKTGKGRTVDVSVD